MILIMGGGKMGSAIARSLLTGVARAEVTVVQRSQDKRYALESELPGATVTDVPVACDLAVIAVKPKDVESAVTNVVSSGARRVLSVAAGIPLDHLQQWAGSGVPVMRAMPNVGAAVAKSATALSFGPCVSAQDVVVAHTVLDACGSVVEVDESLINAVTGLSGSGPGYLFMIAEAMTDAGVRVGLPRDVAQRLAVQTFVGAAALLQDGASPLDLRAMVTTPGQTTAAGLHALESHSIRAAMIDAVVAATERSAQLARVNMPR